MRRRTNGDTVMKKKKGKSLKEMTIRKYGKKRFNKMLKVNVDSSSKIEQ